MKKEIRLYDLFDGDYRYKEVPEDLAREAFYAFRAYVADHTRGKRKERISRVIWLPFVNNLNRDYPVTSRLTYNFDTKEVHYICGQEWHSEMARLRGVFD